MVRIYDWFSYKDRLPNDMYSTLAILVREKQNMICIEMLVDVTFIGRIAILLLSGDSKIKSVNNNKYLIFLFY